VVRTKRSNCCAVSEPSVAASSALAASCGDDRYTTNCGQSVAGEASRY
jgi:hypothetical protein